LKCMSKSIKVSTHTYEKLKNLIDKFKQYSSEDLDLKFNDIIEILLLVFNEHCKTDNDYREVLKKYFMSKIR